MRKRNKEIKLRLTEKEFDNLTKRSSESGFSREKYIRTMIFDCKIPQPLPPHVFYTVLDQIRKIGNNLNQLTKLSYITRSVDYDKIYNLYSELNEELLSLKKEICLPKDIKDNIVNE